MKRVAWLCAFVVLAVMSADAAKVPCEDDLPHVLNVAVPRTRVVDEETNLLPRILENLFGPAYVDPCGAGKELQIHLAFGSDYEVLDWLERGSVEAAVVPHLSLHLLGDRRELRELSSSAEPVPDILRPLPAVPECRRYAGGRWTACNAESTFDAFTAALARGDSPGDVRVMFSSHLSSTGFLAPIQRAAARVTTKTDAERKAFWEQFFSVARFRIDASPKIDPFALALEEEKVKGALTVIAWPGEETLRASGVMGGTGTTWAQHFVITPEAAELLPRAPFGKPWNGGSLPIDPAIDKMIKAGADAPSVFAQLAHVDPTYGTRTFSFTIRESLRLLHQQQRSSSQSGLALVLPGGGVKAAYQSRIIDSLYKDGMLRNEGAGEAEGALTVRSVLGTSGGALLGYFVSQLSANGPYNLFEILWRPDGELLDAEHVFAWTDMMRYFSMAWTFLVFCVVLAIVTGRHSSEFYRRTQAPIGSWRPRLLTVLAVFLAVPVLIRYATRATEGEDVPVIEGLFYLIITVLVMFADQCLIHVRKGVENRKLRLHVAVIAGLGAAFVLLSLPGVSGDLLREPVPFGFAFVTLTSIFLGGPLLLLFASGRFGQSRQRILDLFVSLAAVVVLCAFGLPARLPRQVPHVLALLVLIALAIAAYLYSQREDRKPVVASTLTFLTMLSTAVLCWSDEVEATSWRPSLSFFMRDAFERTAFGPFLASTGCLLLVMAALVWVYQDRQFALRSGEDFALGLGLLVLHSFLTAVCVFLISTVAPSRVHNLEMTASFWVALTLVGALLAVAILALARRVEIVRRAVRFLRSEHPNGALIPRRYARMLAVASVSVIWWNVLVAPALYGNGSAREYLEGAVERFDAAFRAAHGQPETAEVRGFLPTARFVTPANTLDVENSTRYFLFEVPGREVPVRTKRVAGALWNMYEMTTETVDHQNCTEILNARCTGFVHDVIFSSGSPFPIFAAHRVQIPGEPEPVHLIDGGYSNVIPIDAARQTEARQALIVHSSSPFAPDDGESLLQSFGMLVQNAGRLPAFMFERGQLVDRISRQDLFVVSLAPRLKPGQRWPGLAQFDEATVQALLDEANDDLYERIGFVESWGEPRFRFSKRVGSAPPATPAGR